MLYHNILYGIMIIILLIAIYKITHTLSIINVGKSLINGFWQGHPSFCNESEIDMFCIYFAPEKIQSSLSNNSHEIKNMCWILITRDNQILTNHFTTYSVNTKWTKYDNWSSDITKPRHFEITLKELPENMKYEFPKTLELQIYLDTTKLIMIKKKKVYFVGYKDCKISDLINVEVNYDNDNDNDNNFKDSELISKKSNIADSDNL